MCPQPITEDEVARDTGSESQHIPVEINVVTDADRAPPVADDSRIDVSVGDRIYPTAALETGEYVAWWFEADAPAPDDPVTTEWVVAPTRFLAAGTLHELWQDPAAFDRLAE